VVKCVTEVAIQLLREKLPTTHQMIVHLIQIELAYINTNHPDFMGGAAALATLEKLRERKKFESTTMTTPMGSMTAALVKQAYTDMLSQEKKSNLLGKDGGGSGLLHYFFGNRDKTKSELPPPPSSSSSSSLDHHLLPFPKANVDSAEKDTSKLEDNTLSISIDTSSTPPPLSEKEEMETYLIRKLIKKKILPPTTQYRTHISLKSLSFIRIFALFEKTFKIWFPKSSCVFSSML
jgi:dynamin 1-like protein